MPKIFRKTDILIIALLCFAAVFTLLNSDRLVLTGTGQGVAVVVIRCDGEVFATAPLDVDTSVDVTSPSGEVLNVVTIADGRASVSYADCADLLCRKQGEIARAGRVIVCLPNRVTVEIHGSLPSGVAQDEIDAVIG